MGDGNRMRIGDYNPAVNRPEPAPEKPIEDSGRGAAPKKNDAVELSNISRLAAETAPDKARLEELRLQVASGAYQVSAGRISRKIVEFLEG